MNEDNSNSTESPGADGAHVPTDDQPEEQTTLFEGLPHLIKTVRDLECGTIIIVDDEVPDIEQLRAELKGMDSPPNALRVEVEERGGWPANADERWDLIQSIVDQQPFAARRTTTSALYVELAKGSVDWESKFAAPLVELRSAVESLVVLSVSPRDWERHRPMFDATAGKEDSPGSHDLPIDGTPICLFDFDLSGVDGRRKGDGLVLAKEYSLSAGTHTAYCGVISQVFNNPAAVEAERKKIKAEDRDRLVLLSKHDMQDYETLARLLKLVYRAHSAVLLRGVARDALKKACENATKELNDLEVAPLLHVVVDRSYIEGISEFDTVKRLLLLKIIGGLDQFEVDDTLQPLIVKIRAMKLPAQDPPEAVVDLAHEERYARIDRVNKRNLPIELGDIFELTQADGRKGKYVLVTQSCDLAVRSNGERQVNDGVLLRITDKQPRPASMGFELHYAKNKGPGGSRGSLFVKFRPPFFAPLFVLDFCAFSGTGRSTFSASGIAPRTVPASMVALHALLKEYVGSVIRAAAESQEGAAPQTGTVSTRVLSVPLGAVQGVLGRVRGESVQYDVERTGRLNSTVANELLAEYSQFTGRIASEMDLAERVSS